VRYLEHDPRASVLVVDPNDAYRGVAVSGHAELADDADEQIDKLAKKHIDPDSYRWRNPNEQRVSVWIAVEKVDSAGFDEPGG
jgi:nitroimidazol reductase NimA-like FMN-containing flavoprotein (pyridoxamine 5'-phosphate oxidase superfamily)